tara:strand:- start:1133 stop:2356 length:1224 start_codon:yes stop_codon:yes gene_type:complete
MKKKKKKKKKIQKKIKYKRTKKITKKFSKKIKYKRTKKITKKLSKKKSTKKQKKFKSKKSKIKKKLPIYVTKKSDKFLLKIIELQSSLKPEFKIKFNPFVAIDNFLQKFFQKVSDTISKYQVLKDEQKKIRRLYELEKIENEKIERQNKLKAEKDLRIKLKEQMLKDEIKLEKQRAKDIKIFLRKEQAIIRQEQAKKQRKFFEQLKIEKQIEKFRIREIKELEQLEKVSLREQREDYSSLQERIDKLKEKYRIIRDQKIRERVEALGVKIQGDEDRETLLQKERDYTIARQKIEFALESFYRSSSSLVFQLNKRHITRHMSILRCIDRRFENGEIFIKWDESDDDQWLLLIYIKNNSPDEGIVIEDKTNPEKNLSHEFKSTEIFKASDLMVDSLTQLIANIRKKKEE